MAMANMGTYGDLTPERMLNFDVTNIWCGIPWKFHVYGAIAAIYRSTMVVSRNKAIPIAGWLIS